MNFTAQELEKGSGVLLVRSKRFVDSRGHFLEVWSKAAYSQIGINADFVQDNQSLSTARGTLRGLHFQRAPFEQAKLIRVLKGAIYDVVVDIRPNSPNYGRWIGTALSADEGEQLFIPRGYAHGFLTLSSETIVSYKVDAPYSRESEAGIRWNDPELNVRWPLIYSEIVLSEKDVLLPLFSGSAGATHKNIRAVES